MTRPLRLGLVALVVASAVLACEPTLRQAEGAMIDV